MYLQMRKILLLLFMSSLLLTACNPIVRYKVKREIVEQCIIRVNGEFCDEAEFFEADVISDWSIEVSDEHRYIFHDEEMWIADEVKGESEILKRSEKFSGGCTIRLERRLIFVTENKNFSGTLEIKKRTEGPSSCGATPFGERHLYRLYGEVTNEL